MSKREVYFDHAATTPLRPEVLTRMLPYLKSEYGNPNSLYARGQRARRAIEKARAQIAAVIKATPSEIFFTSSATEADQLALTVPFQSPTPDKNQIIVSALEHKGILAMTRELKKTGWEIIIAPVEKNGLIKLEEFKKLLNKQTALVSITMADSETGTLQPIREISEIIQKFKTSSLQPSPFPLFHTDASQAAAYAEVNVKKLGVDLLTLSAHKLGGPKGAAALYVKKGVRFSRPHTGTENVPAIVGFGAAMELNEKNKKAEAVKVKKLRDYLETNILKTIPKTLLNGHPTKRLPNFSNLSFLDIEGEAILLYLDEVGIMASTGSACDAENLKPSTVLTALGNPYEFVHGSIRLTLGHENSAADVKYVLAKLPAIIATLRQISPLNLSPRSN